MRLLILSCGLLASGGLAALLAAKSRRWSCLIGAGTAVLGCAVGLWPALSAALGAPAQSVRLAWPLPGMSLALELDALSGFFLVPTLLICALAAVYGAGYLRDCKRPVGLAWFAYNLLVLSMALVMLARNGILFLLAWEVMSLASFFLVCFENDDPAVREAGWVYLIATHLGSAFLLALFVLMAKASGSFDFAAWNMLPLPAARAGLLFIFAVVGFGTKAGFLPLHVWLPEAHPAAPSHVSAVMSGVMIKTGIYGLLRFYLMLESPPDWCGWLLLVIGLASGVVGVLFALAQHDLKRLLAYHSVENIGIISLGLGLGMLGVSWRCAPLAVLGFGGGLLHVLNHALFKGLLFLGAGSVLHATGARELDHLGGLLKRMPLTGATFLVGAAAISGLPLLNGFVSEFLIYLGSFQSLIAPRVPAAPALLAIGGLALIGGLASACFAKAFGIVFLGEPRTGHAQHAHESGPAMIWPMAILSAACVAIGLLPWLVVRALGPLLEAVTRLPAAEVEPVLGATGAVLATVTLAAGLLLGAALLLTLLRRGLLSGRQVETAPTWDCGYALPNPKMQYTASSFAQPLLAFFWPVLRTRQRLAGLQGLFPGASSWMTETRDTYREFIFEPLFAGVRRLLGRMRGLQQGRMQLYVLYVALALLVLLVWAMKGGS
jgi:formate hydrogenlyase subunit 3/multisubunit Na+/H+ antiporter MnhD subunit